ncbi:MAG: putative oxidoreductase C-terminal domain-containing protein, partial [Planctomycetota bacterium]
MVRRRILAGLLVVLMAISLSCAKKETPRTEFTGAKGEVKLMTLDPGHFHAALVQKKTYEQVAPKVH